MKNQFKWMPVLPLSSILETGRSYEEFTGDFVVYTAGNFGRQQNIRTSKCMARLFLGFTLGYSYGSFMDLAALPATIDFAGPNGSAFYRTTQLSYLYSGLKTGNSE